MTVKDIRIGRIAGSGGPAPRTGTPRVPVSQAEGARKGGGPEGPEKELDRQMSGPVSSSDFLALWDVLAMPSGCRELKEAWNRSWNMRKRSGRTRWTRCGTSILRDWENWKEKPSTALPKTKRRKKWDDGLSEIR